MGCGMPGNLPRFQQEGVISHTSNALLRFLQDIFEERAISNRILLYLRKDFHGHLPHRAYIHNLIL
jgi:hypothetical protein